MKYNRLSKYKIKKIIECFARDLTATTTSQLLSINRNTINSYYNEIREKILQASLDEYQKEFGEFELDESYFGARRVRGKRGNGKVYVTVVPNCSREELMPIIQVKILKGSTIHTDATIIACFITRMNLQEENPMLTVLNVFGVMQKEDLLNLMV